ERVECACRPRKRRSGNGSRIGRREVSTINLSHDPPGARAMTRDESLSIGEVAARTGVRPSALRYYESVGLLPPPPRVSGGRRYGELTVGFVALVRLAQRAGFRVDEIRTLLHGFTPDVAPAARWRQLAAQKVVELD